MGRSRRLFARDASEIDGAVGEARGRFRGPPGPPRPPPVGVQAPARRDAATTTQPSRPSPHRRPANPFPTLTLLEAYGVMCWLDAANSRLPVSIVTVRALPMLLPSFARLPSTVTMSPTFIVLRVQP